MIEKISKFVMSKWPLLTSSSLDENSVVDNEILKMHNDLYGYFTLKVSLTSRQQCKQAQN